MVAVNNQETENCCIAFFGFFCWDPCWAEYKWMIRFLLHQAKRLPLPKVKSPLCCACSLHPMQFTLASITTTSENQLSARLSTFAHAWYSLSSQSAASLEGKSSAKEPLSFSGRHGVKLCLFQRHSTTRTEDLTPVLIQLSSRPIGLGLWIFAQLKLKYQQQENACICTSYETENSQSIFFVCGLPGDQAPFHQCTWDLLRPGTWESGRPHSWNLSLWLIFRTQVCLWLSQQNLCLFAGMKDVDLTADRADVQNIHNCLLTPV